MIGTTPTRLVLGIALVSLFLVPEAQARRARYYRHPNLAQCEAYSWRPQPKSIPGGRSTNSRAPFMTNSIHRYLTQLNARSCGLVVQSTFRDCVTNSNVGGAQKSRHLCGAGADTSGCSKATARSACAASGLHYIEEGRAKLPHCQINLFCNQIDRAREGGGGSTASAPLPPRRPEPAAAAEKPNPESNACYYAIFACATTQAGAEEEKSRIGGGVSVVHTDDVKNFNKGWYCVVSGPSNADTARSEVQQHRGRTPGYVKKGC